MASDLLRRVEVGQGVVVVTRLDRLSRSENSEDAQAMLLALLDRKFRAITETDVFDLRQPVDAARWRLASGLRTEQAASSTHGRERAWRGE